MVELPAQFGHCCGCGRLITVDANNPDGRCVQECGGTVLRVFTSNVLAAGPTSEDDVKGT